MTVTRAAPVLSTPAEHILDEPRSPIDPSQVQDLADDHLIITFEIERTVQKIRQHKWKRIALQFPDHMLCNAPRVYEHLVRGLKKEQRQFSGTQEQAVQHSKVVSTKLSDCLDATRSEEHVRLEEKLFILGDTSYGACCVDEVAAEHVDADVIVHYGRSCLSPPSRLQVLYVFTEQPLDLDSTISTFKDIYANKSAKVILMADIPYSHHTPILYSRLRSEGFTNIYATKILHNPSSLLPNRTLPSEVAESEEALLDYHLFHISDPPTSLLLTLSSRVSSVHVYPTNKTSPSTVSTTPTATLSSTSALLRRRYALITSLSNAPIFGILINTLSVKNYMSILSHVQSQITAAGKKYYTFVVGKVNAAKVANFSEIEGWVVIGCWESSLVDSKEFWRPMITPWELGVALMGDEERVWTGAWEATYQKVLDNAKTVNGEAQGTKNVVANRKPLNSKELDSPMNGQRDCGSDEESAPPEFDLRTGRYISYSRPLATTTMQPISAQPTALNPSSDTALAKRVDGTIASIGGVVSPGAEFLRSKRTWQGLGSDFTREQEEQGGSARAARMEEGRRGIARGYMVGSDGSEH